MRRGGRGQLLGTPAAPSSEPTTLPPAVCGGPAAQPLTAQTEVWELMQPTVRGGGRGLVEPPPSPTSLRLPRDRDSVGVSPVGPPALSPSGLQGGESDNGVHTRARTHTHPRSCPCRLAFQPPGLTAHEGSAPGLSQAVCRSSEPAPRLGRPAPVQAGAPEEGEGPGAFAADLLLRGSSGDRQAVGAQLTPVDW